MKTRLKSLSAKAPAPLRAILLATFISSVAWMLVVPVGQAPDEESHFSYTQKLVEQGELPQEYKPDVTGHSTEWTVASKWATIDSLIGNVNARPSWSAWRELEWQKAVSELPSSGREDISGRNRAHNNPPLYYLYASLPYLAAYNGTFFDRAYLIRLASVILFLITVVLTWAIGQELFGRRMWPSALAAALVGLLPMVAFISSSIGPDALLITLWTAFILYGIRLIRRGPSTGRVLGLAVICSLALLTHPRSAAVIVGAGFAVAYSLWRYRLPAVKSMTLTVGAVAIVAIPIGLWYAIISSIGTDGGGNSVYSPETAAFNIKEFASYLWQFYLPKLHFMHNMIGPDYGWQVAFSDTFWGKFGSLDVVFSDSTYKVLRAITLVIVGAVVAAVIVKRHIIRKNRATFAFLLVTAIALLLSLHVGAYLSLLTNPSDPIIVGRYLFPLISLLGLAIAFVVSVLPARYTPYLCGALVGAIASFDVLSIGLTALRYYA